MLSPETLNLIEALASDMRGLFTPPELYVGCEVLDVSEKDSEATDNGWIEARVAQHNRQRCRWLGNYPNPQVGDFVDVFFFPTWQLFKIWGKTGTGAISATRGVAPPYGKVHLLKADGSVGVYTDLATVFAAASAGETIWLGPGIYTLTSTITWDKAVNLIGVDRDACIITTSTLNSNISVTASNCYFGSFTISNSRSVADTTSALQVANCDNVFMDRIYFGNTNGNAGSTACGLHIVSTSAAATGHILGNCRTDATGAAGTNYGILLDDQSGNNISVIVRGGMQQGDDAAIRVESVAGDHTIEMFDLPKLENGITDTGSGGYTVAKNGAYWDPAVDEIVIEADLHVINNTQIDGTLDVTGLADFQEDVDLDSKGALRGNDTWLRLNPDGDFTSGTLVPNDHRVQGNAIYESPLLGVSSSEPDIGSTTAAEKFGSAYLAQVIEALWHDFPLVDTANDSGITSHFRDNDGSFPAGWTETDAAAGTDTSTKYSFWRIFGTSSDTAWDYRRKSDIDLEALGASEYATFTWGPILLRDGGFTADLHYYFGLYRNNAGSIDTGTYVRADLYWDSGAGLWKIRGEERDGSTAHTGSYITLDQNPLHPLYIRMNVLNSAAKSARVYVGATPTLDADILLMSQSPTSAPTWDDIWARTHMSRGAGITDILFIGALDYLGNVA